MAMPILQSPDPRVRTICSPVTHFDESLKLLALNLLRALHASPRPGLGLSANQIGDLRRVFVIDEDSGHRAAARSNAMVFVNPSIRKARGEQTKIESCLSLPASETRMMTRAKIINWNAFDLDGNPVSGKASDMLARVFQHELDHLDGKLIVDLDGRS